MRTHILLVVLFVSALVVLITSCSSDNEKEIIAPKSVTLAVAGGESVIVSGTDVTREVTITASEAPDKDVLVTLIPENAEEGEVTFASNHLLLVAGETTAKTLIAFTAKGFPAGTAEKNIGITISSSTDNVVIGSDKTTTFAVKGLNGPEMVKLAVTTPDGSSFDTTSSNGVSKILFTLDSALDFDLPITIQYAEGCDIDVQGASSWNPFPMSIPKGQLSAVQTITVNQGIAGIMKLKINLEPGDNVKLDREKIDITFLKYEASIVPKNLTNVRVSKMVSATRTFTLALTNPAIKPVNVNLQLTGDPRGGVSMNCTNPVQFAVGEQSKEIILTFSKDVFNSKDISETVTVTLTSMDVPLTSGKETIIYQVTGERTEAEKEQLALEFKTEGTGEYPRDEHRMDLPYGDASDRYDLWVGAKQDIEQMQNVILDVELQGFAPGDYSCNDINSEGQYILKPHNDPNNGNITLDNWLFNIRFNPSAKGKNGKIVFRSNDATISSGEIIITVK